MIPVEYEYKRLSNEQRVNYLARFGPPHFKLSKKDWIVFEQAKKDGHVTVVASKRRNDSVGNLWYEWCKAQDKPYLKVCKKAKTANIVLDFYSSTRDLSPVGVKEFEKLFYVIQDSGLLPKRTNIYTFMGKDRCEIWPVPNEILGQMVVKIKDIIDTHWQFHNPRKSINPKEN